MRNTISPEGSVECDLDLPLRETLNEIIRSLSTYFQVIDVTLDVSQQAVDLKRSFKLPTVDCLIYASAKDTGATVVSGCKHFRGISGEKDVMII